MFYFLFTLNNSFVFSQLDYLVISFKYHVFSCLITRVKPEQVEAGRLKSIVSTGARGSHTKIVVLGIGNSVSVTELTNMASAPASKNVIRVQDFTSLSTAENQLRITSCTRK